MKFRKERITADKTALDMVNKKLDGFQHKAADFLNRKTEKWSGTRLKIALMLFCIVMGSASLYTIGYALRNDHGPPSVSVGKIQAPVIKKAPERDNKPDSINHKQITNER